jgi:hypothetical protein
VGNLVFTEEELAEMRKNNFKKGYRNVLTCSECDDNIYSSKEGQYKSCKCGAISIDETMYYYRVVNGEKVSECKMIRFGNLDSTKE